MPNTKLTKRRLKNHFQYSKWIYVIVALVAGFAADLSFTTTAYRPPKARKIDIELVDSYANTENAGVYAQTALEAGRAYELARDQAAGIDVGAADYSVPLEEVSFYNIAYSGSTNASSEEDYYGAQKYMVMLGAQEGDIYIVSRALMESLVASGVAVPLDEYIAQGVIRPGERDLSRVTYDEYVDEGEPLTGNTYVYAIQADTLTGMSDAFTVDMSNKYMVIMAYSQNQDTAAAVLQSLIDQFEREPEPEEDTLPGATAEPAQTGEPTPAETAEPVQTGEPTPRGTDASDSDAGAR